LVQYDKQGKPFTVYYHLLTPLLLSEVQHQQTQLATLRTQNIALKKQLTTLERQQQIVLKAVMERLNQLEQTVQTIRNTTPNSTALPASTGNKLR